MRIVAIVICVWLLAGRAAGVDAGTAQTRGSVGASNRSSTAIVSEIIKLMDARMGTEVIRGFIEQWPTPYLTSAEDLRHLKQAGADSPTLTAFARRGAELRLRASRDGLERSPAATATNLSPIVFYPVAASVRLGSSFPPDWNVNSPELYPFSEALWWWSNFYPYPRYGMGWAGHYPPPPFIWR
jgi:hypothetical protein